MKISLIVLAASALFLGETQGTSAASFDCNKASTTLEMTICSDDGLSGMDDLMVQAYAGAEARATTAKSRKSLTADQRAWLKSRAPCADDLGCLIGMYDDRIEYLNHWMP